MTWYKKEEHLNGYAAHTNLLAYISYFCFIKKYNKFIQNSSQKKISSCLFYCYLNHQTSHLLCFLKGKCHNRMINDQSALCLNQSSKLQVNKSMHSLWEDTDKALFMLSCYFPQCELCQHEFTNILPLNADAWRTEMFWLILDL